MKKYLAILCASMMCVCCLALAACGGNAASSSASASASASAAESASVSSVAADPSEQFIGDWKLACIEMQGITVTGDYSAILGSESTETMGLTIKEGGTGSMSFAGDATDITWELKGDDTIAVTPTSESSSMEAVDVVAKDDSLQMTMSDDELTGTVVFTKDGTWADAKEITADAATAITSESDLIGTWKMSGASMAGMTMYGDADALSAAMGTELDSTLVFEQGGKAKAFGEDATWSIGSDGAVIESSGIQIPVKALGDDLVIDGSSFMGGSVTFLMVFSK